MKITENYNNAAQKYGLDVVKELSSLGLPPKYHQSACKWKREYNVPSDILVGRFRDWITYVIKNQNVDVNQISYEDFISLIAERKRKCPFRNVIIGNYILFDPNALKTK